MEPPDALPVPYAPSATHSTNASTAQGRCPLRELTADAILSADAAVPSPVHLLSLQAPHRRGWGRASTPRWTGGGSRDAEALRGLLARNPLLAGGGDELPVFAVDVSGLWPRCDAEASSPERGFYYHPSRHSACQPIVVAGWAYQFIAKLTNFVRESWTAPVDVHSACAPRRRTPTRWPPSR